MSYIPVGWPLASLARSAAIAAALSVGLTAEAQATDQTPAPANQAMTPAPAKGEFNNFYTEGLASGQLAKIDCSVNWTNSDSGMYCFLASSFVEDDIGEPAIALHAAYRLDLLEQKIEVSIKLRVVEHEGSVH